MQTSAERDSSGAPARRPSDRELIARFLASRDESAFAEIVSRYSRLVMSVALHTLRDPHAAEDAFQAAFLVLAKSARRIRNRDSLASWLHGTTYRVSHRLLRTRLRRKEQDLPSVELPSPIWAEPERPDEQAALDEELARLSEGLRGPLVLHYLEGRTVPEIAAELMMSQDAIKSRLKRGKKVLRQRLLKRGVLLSSAIFGAGLTVPAQAQVTTALLTATVAACIKATTAIPLAPIAASTVQQLALQEMAAMTRAALIKTTLLSFAAVGAIGIVGTVAQVGPRNASFASDKPKTTPSPDIKTPDDLEVPQQSFRLATQIPKAKTLGLVQPVDRELVQPVDRESENSGGKSDAASGPQTRAEGLLNNRISVSLSNSKLSDWFQQLAKDHQVPIIVEGNSLEDVSALLSSRAEVVAKGIKTKAILESILEEANGRAFDVSSDSRGVRISPRGKDAVHVSVEYRSTGMNSSMGSDTAEASRVVQGLAIANKNQGAAAEDEDDGSMNGLHRAGGPIDPNKLKFSLPDYLPAVHGNVFEYEKGKYLQIQAWGNARRWYIHGEGWDAHLDLPAATKLEQGQTFILHEGKDKKFVAYVESDFSNDRDIGVKVIDIKSGETLSKGTLLIHASRYRWCIEDMGLKDDEKSGAATGTRQTDVIKR